MSSFTTDAGVHVTEHETDSGDFSFTWVEHHGIDNTPVRFELTWHPARRKWLRRCQPSPEGGMGPAMQWDWPAVEDMDEAREMVKKRIRR